jgi:hypothetical protein
MQKWEYKVLSHYPNQDELNELGQEGWNLVAVVAGGLTEAKLSAIHASGGASEVFAYLKRFAD